MLHENTYKWLGAYLYYNEPWESFLIEAIEPYVRTAIQTGIAKQYFFIRYWDRGPHIRLRFKAEQHLIDQLLRSNLEEHFLSYFDSKPSTRTEPNYPPDFPQEYKWLANNSVQYVEYEQELERYAGPVGMAITEQQFQLSSELALQELKSSGQQWSYDDALGTAIKLHLSFIHAMGMDLEEAYTFFHFLFYNWLPRSLQYFHRKRSHQEYQQQSKEAIEAFAHSFMHQKEALIPYHQVLWKALEEEAEFEEVLMNQWIASNKDIAKQIQEATQEGLLWERPKDYQFKGQVLQKTLSANSQREWMLYADFIHMTNNRLGILNKDEGFLGYLMTESLRNLM